MRFQESVRSPTVREGNLLNKSLKLSGAITDLAFPKGGVLIIARS
jgi:hypothetical protein